jgi:hypothetical protein
MIGFFLAAPAEIVIFTDSAFIANIFYWVGFAFFAFIIMRDIIIFLIFLFQ